MLALAIDVLFAILASYWLHRWYLRVPFAFVLGLFSSFIVLPVMIFLTDPQKAALSALGSIPFHALLTAVLAAVLGKRVRAWKAQRAAERNANNWR